MICSAYTRHDTLRDRFVGIVYTDDASWLPIDDDEMHKWKNVYIVCNREWYIIIAGALLDVLCVLSAWSESAPRRYKSIGKMLAEVTRDQAHTLRHRIKFGLN